VVAGRVGGRRLESRPGETTRPTSERVREAVFSSLGGETVDATVLDLYAGTGAMAIEALSRGATRAVLVESDHAVADVIRHNLATTGFAEQGRVVERAVAPFLALPPPPEAPFTLVTCDPPYATAEDEIAAVLAALTEPRWLAPDATVVLERGVRSPIDPVPSGWRLRFARAYGDTLVTLLSAGASDSAT
jgi:16S rRNA (guanine966-N2)-methyltransferase